MKRFLLHMFAVGLVSGLLAQEVSIGLPIEDLIAKQDQAVLDRHGAEVFKAFDKLAAPYRESVVGIIAGDRLLVCGIVVAPGFVMSKYSDLTRTRKTLAVVDAARNIYDMRVKAASIENDLALIEVPGLKSKPLDLTDPKDVEEGSMVFLYSPEGKAVNYGVLSVEQRSLREEDQAFIGISLSPIWREKGARVERIDLGSPAHVQGLLPGDIIETLNGKEIDGGLSVRTLLNEVNPGDKIKLDLTRRGQRFVAEIVAGRRTPMKGFPQKRLEQMNAMGNRMSYRRNNFPIVYQSDITILPEQAGSPVIDLNGNFVGMALSRAGRIETYILPAWVIKELAEKIIKDKPVDIPVADPVED